MIIRDISNKLGIPLDYNVSNNRRIPSITLEVLLSTLLSEKTAKDAAVKLNISRSTITSICKDLFPDKDSKKTWSQYLLGYIGKKRCSSCGEAKPLEDFADSKDKGKHIMCRPCLYVYGSARYFENKQQHLEWNSAWRKNNPNKAKAIAAKRRANLLNAKSDDADLGLIKLIYQGCPAGYHVDHIMPLSKGGKHHELNLCYLPESANLSKKDKLPEEVPDIMKLAIYPLEESIFK